MQLCERKINENSLVQNNNKLVQTHQELMIMVKEILISDSPTACTT